MRVDHAARKQIPSVGRLSASVLRKERGLAVAHPAHRFVVEVASASVEAEALCQPHTHTHTHTHAPHTCLSDRHYVYEECMGVHAP